MSSSVQVSSIFSPSLIISRVISSLASPSRSCRSLKRLFISALISLQLSGYSFNFGRSSAEAFALYPLQARASASSMTACISFSFSPVLIPRSTSALTSKMFARTGSWAMSGAVLPHSHWDTAREVIPRYSASCSCVISRFLRRFRMVAPMAAADTVGAVKVEDDVVMVFLLVCYNFLPGEISITVCGKKGKELFDGGGYSGALMSGPSCAGIYVPASA